mmetsp:Transcript_86329/g.225167  ORF Transcript_86329/g.225167 Transcript_86329/m.225167 type:complete len:218 (-) Transcript_86329:106-759(-)
MHEVSVLFSKQRRTEFHEQHIMKFAERNSATYKALLHARAVGIVALLALGIAELSLWFAAGTSVGACELPLPSWLVADGSATLLFCVLSLCRVVKKRSVLGNVELQAYLLRKDRGGDADPVHDGKMESLDTGILEWVIWPWGLLLVASFAAGGWWCRAAGHSPACEGELARLTVFILLGKLLVPCLSCCLAMSCCAYTFLSKDPKESYWADSATDMW